MFFILIFKEVWKELSQHLRILNESLMDEIKYFIDFGYSDASCNIISLGKTLKTRLTKCFIYGLTGRQMIYK